MLDLMKRLQGTKRIHNGNIGNNSEKEIIIVGIVLKYLNTEIF